MLNKIKDIYNKYEEIIMYLFIGGLTTVISLGIKYLLLFTVLDAKNPLQLQISVILSWIGAVIFAYFTNRKFVFKSKTNKKLQEVIKFFSSRLVTLAMESIILWFFINFLKMNSDFYVFIWTIVTQFLIVIGNYILSKFFVFKKDIENDKKDNKFVVFVKNNLLFVCMFFVFVILCYIFPYTHDDWGWGIKEIGIEERFNTFFKDYNGRYAGNYLVLLLTRFKLLKTFIMAGVITLIIYLMKKVTSVKNKSSIYLMIILFMLMQQSTFSQVVPWVSGFSNYAFPVLSCLIFINLNLPLFENKKTNLSNWLIIPLLILGFIGSLFIEHVTIYNLFLCIFILIVSYKKSKKISFPNLFYFVGSIMGTILMFSNGAYHKINSGTDFYRTVPTDENFFVRGIKTYFDTIYKFFIQNNLIINLILSIMILLIAYKYLKKNKVSDKIKNFIIKPSMGIIIFFNVYNIFNYVYADNALSAIRLIKYAEGSLAGLYYIALMFTSIICIETQKRKLMLGFLYGSNILIVAPLLIVTPLNARCFFMNCIIYIMIAIYIFEYIISKSYLKVDLSNLLKYTMIILFMFFTFVYSYIYKVDCDRIKYIEKYKHLDEIVLPKLPFGKFIYYGEPYFPEFNRRFRIFYGIDEDSDTTFISYGKWKKLQD